MAALKVLSNPRDELALTIALMSPVVGLDINEMAMLKYRSKMSRNRIYETLGQLRETDEALGRRERLKRFHQALAKYLPIRTLIRPSELAEMLVEDLNYAAFLAIEDSTGRKTANLRKFIITAKRLDEAGVSLCELVRMFNRVGLDDEEQASIESEETNAVKIMTVHKAKGLEFPILIVGDTSWNQKDSKESLLFNKDEDGICFTLNCEDNDESAETFLRRLMEKERNRDFEEEKQSLYIATTRASDMLVLTISTESGVTRTVNTGSFSPRSSVTESFNADQIGQELVSVNSDAQSQQQSSESTPIAGKWSMEFNFGSHPKASLNLFQNGDVVYGTGVIVLDPKTNREIAAGGTVMGDKMNLDVISLGNVSLYSISMTVIGNSASGTYTAFRHRASPISGTSTGLRSITQSKA